MSEPSLPAPDPALSANLYCAGRLDEVIHGCVAPFWREARAGGARLRLARYLRGGEHLKIRIHAPEEASADLHAALEGAAQSFLAALGPAPAPDERRRDASPPIDLEDEAPDNHPDRQFLWTHYRRSHVELGDRPFLDDDAYVARMALCHAEAAEKVLAALQPDAQGSVPFRARQNTLLKAVVVAVASLGWGPEQRSDYLAYHRNWLLRFVLGQGRQGPELGAELVGRLDVGVKKLGPALDAYRKLTDAHFGVAAEPGPEGPDASWRAAIRALDRHLAPFAGKPGYQIDPFAPHPTFPALFKVLHGLGNQLGLKPSDEAFAHHLLLGLSGRDEARHRFTIEPPAPPVEP